MSDAHASKNKKEKAAPAAAIEVATNTAEHRSKYKGGSLSEILWDALIIDIVVLKGVPFLWEVAKRFLDRNADHHIQKPSNLRIFAEAMNKLRIEDQAAYDTLEHFMRAPDGLNSDPKDLEDFQLRSAEIGGVELEPTVLFLKRVAEPSRHGERKTFLERYGIIGSRAVDAHEKVMNFITDTKSAVLKAGARGMIGGAAVGATSLNWLNQQLNSIAPASKDNAETASSQFRDSARQRYQNRKAARRR
jgi:hypothetical protein